jgi:deoxyribose-phosphate aldolase
MTRDRLASHIDLSLLRPDATMREIEALVSDAQRYPFASICIPPCHVRLAARTLGESPVKVGTVVGFPFGYQSTDVKLQEAWDAVDAGAEEIDMVMNISMFKSGELAMVQDEVSSIVSALSGVVVKVIIETCYLTEEEKAKACEMVIKSNAEFVKTSTGFGPAGATAPDVKLLAGAASGRIKVKAAGGIRNLDDALRMIEAGASRIGTSAGVRIVEGLIEGA